MQIDKLVISTEQKNSWQCFDLGCRVAVRHYKLMFWFWLTITLPIFTLAMLVSVNWGLFIFWLAKPLYERGLLYILSRAVFGNTVSLWQSLMTWPSQMKPLWFSSITFRRLAPSRSFDMAVTQLEKLRGERRSKRLKSLHRSKDNTVWWTICCVHWETFLVCALLVLLKILLPQEFDQISTLDFFTANLDIANLAFSICMFIAIALVAPFYVAGGFIAYLNSRMILEGWDIEIGFKNWKDRYLTNTSNKNLSQETKKETRLPPSSSSSLVLITALILTMSLSPMLSAPGLAQSTDQENHLESTAIAEKDIDPYAAPKAPILDNLEKVFNEDPFGGSEIVTRYRLKDFGNKDEIESEGSYPELLKSIALVLASSIEIILWCALIALIVYVIYRNRKLIKALFTIETIKDTDAPLPSFITRAFSEELPDDVVNSVEHAIKERNYRRALSLLVRASLTKLSQRQKVRITKSMTENECLSEIKNNSTESLYRYMCDLMQAWMRMAWAHQLPLTETLQILTNGYQSHFVESSKATSLSQVQSAEDDS